MRTLLVGAALVALVAPASAAANTYVPCSKGGGPGVSLKAKPRKCNFSYIHNPLALAGRAVGLHWKGWGRRVPARVRLSRRVACGRHRIYTRVTFFDGDDRRSWSVPPRSC